MKIGFAGRVRASSQLSPAFETEASPNDASHSWPSPLQSEPASLPRSLPGHFCGRHPGPGHLHLFLGPCSLLTGVISPRGPSFPFLTRQPGSLSQTQIRSHPSAESLPMASCHSGKKTQLLRAPVASPRSIPKTRPRLCLPVPGTPSSSSLQAFLCSSLRSPQCRLPLIRLPQLNCHLFGEAFPDCTMLSLLLFTSSCLFMSWYRLQLLIILV